MVRLVAWLCLAVLLLSGESVVQPGSRVNLQESRVSSSYKNVLEKSFDAFTLWCVLRGHPRPAELEHNIARMNELLIEHLQFLYDQQRGVAAGRHAVLSVQHRFRAMRSQLTAAWDSVKS